jgi:hypothetical protein
VQHHFQVFPPLLEHTLEKKSHAETGVRIGGRIRAARGGGRRVDF